jgi:hypothetical protein
VEISGQPKATGAFASNKMTQKMGIIVLSLVVLLNDASSTAKFTFNRMSLGQDHK